MKEALSPHAKIVDPFAEKQGGIDFGSLAKTALAGLGIHSAIDFFRKKSSDFGRFPHDSPPPSANFLNN